MEVVKIELKQPSDSKKLYGDFRMIDIPKEISDVLEVLRASIKEQCDNPQNEQIIIKIFDGSNEGDEVFGVKGQMSIGIKVEAD